MSRAALEQAIKEKLGKQSDGKYVQLAKLIQEAEDKEEIDSVVADAARKTAYKCNAVLHERPMSAGDAQSVFIEARGVVEQIFQ